MLENQLAAAARDADSSPYASAAPQHDLAALQESQRIIASECHEARNRFLLSKASEEELYQHGLHEYQRISKCQDWMELARQIVWAAPAEVKSQVNIRCPVMYIYIHGIHDIHDIHDIHT